MTNQKKSKPKKKQSLPHKQEEKGGVLLAVKGSWKILLSIGIALSLAGSLFTFDNRYFKTAAAEQQQKETIKTFEQFQKGFDASQKQLQEDRKRDKLESQLRDLQIEQKLLLRREGELLRAIDKNPKDSRLKDDLITVRRDLDENKSEITATKSQMR